MRGAYHKAVIIQITPHPIPDLRSRVLGVGWGWFYTANRRLGRNMAHTVGMKMAHLTRGTVVFEAVLLVALLGTIATLTNIHTQVALQKTESQLAQTAAAPSSPTGVAADRDNKVTVKCEEGSTGGKIESTKTGQVDVLNPNCTGEIEYTDLITGQKVKLNSGQIQHIQSACSEGKASCSQALESPGVNHTEVKNLFEVRGAGLAAAKSLTDAFNNAYAEKGGAAAVPADVKNAIQAVRNGTATPADLDFIQNSMRVLKVDSTGAQSALERYTGANAHLAGIAQAVGSGDVSRLAPKGFNVHGDPANDGFLSSAPGAGAWEDAAPAKAVEGFGSQARNAERPTSDDYGDGAITGESYPGAGSPLDLAKARLDAAKSSYDSCRFCIPYVSATYRELKTAEAEYDKLLFESGGAIGASGVGDGRELQKLSLVDVGSGAAPVGGTAESDPFSGPTQFATRENTVGTVEGRSGIEFGALPTSPEVEAGRRDLEKLGVGSEIGNSPTEGKVSGGVVTTQPGASVPPPGVAVPPPGNVPPGGQGGNRPPGSGGTSGGPLDGIMKALGGAGNPLGMLSKLLGGLGGGKSGGGSGGGSGSGSGAQAANSNACAQYPGTTLQEGRCNCPSGQSWDGKACTSANPCATYAGTTYNQQANRCDCPSGQTYDGSRCVTQNPASNLKAELSCAPKSQDEGQPIAITWTCTDANASKGNTFNTNNKPTGSASTTAKLPAGTSGLSASVTHALTCSKEGVQQEATCVTTVYKPYAVMVSTPSKEVEKGKSVKLAWVTGAMDEANDACVITADKLTNFRQTGKTGLVTTPELQEDTVFTLSCKTKAGNTKKIEVPVKVR